MKFFERKILHIIFGILFLSTMQWGIAHYGLHRTLQAGGIILLLEMVVEFLRVEYKPWPLLTPLLKKNEVSSFSALTNALVIYLFIFAIFDQAIALATAGIFIFGDGAAGIVGKAWGHHRVSWTAQKTWEGWATFMVVGSLIGLWFVPAIVAIPMTLIAAMLELYTKKLDDNFFTPLIIAFSGMVITRLFL